MKLLMPDNLFVSMTNRVISEAYYLRQIGVK